MLKISSSLVRQVNTAVFEEVVKKKAATKKVREKLVVSFNLLLCLPVVSILQEAV